MRPVPRVRDDDAAQLLQIPPTTLMSRMTSLGLKK
jgi:hypothetical protein